MQPAVYVVVRADIPFRHQAVQACHAGIEAASNGLISKGSENLNLVVLTVMSAADLVQTSIMLTKRGIRHRVFCEEDMNNQATALATEPIGGESRKVFANYPLMK